MNGSPVFDVFPVAISTAEAALSTAAAVKLRNRRASHFSAFPVKELSLSLFSEIEKNSLRVSKIPLFFLLLFLLRFQ